MDGILSPIATFEIDEYSESFNNNLVNQDVSDFLNGNFLDTYPYADSIKCAHTSLQASLENLVHNFDSVISECFNCDEKIDSWSPISDKYKSCNSLIDKNQLWLSLTGSVTKALNLDWYSFKSFEKFKHAMKIPRNDDLINQNLDLPDEDDLISAMDHHSLVASSVPSDFEPLKMADEVIEEIDKIMGISNESFNSRDVASNIDCCDFLDSEDAMDSIRDMLLISSRWIGDFEKLSIRQLNDIVDEFEDSIKDFSRLLVDELAVRDELEYEKEQRDLFVNLIHNLEQQTSRDVGHKKGCDTVTAQCAFRRSNSSRSIFGHGSLNIDWDRDSIIENSRISVSTDNVNKANIGASIPIHKGMVLDKDLLETFNAMLQAMLTHPLRFNQLLTDYILNVYAPADYVSLGMSMEML